MIGSQVKARRAALGMTQAQLAQRLGVSRVTVARWEIDAVAIPERVDRAIGTIEALKAQELKAQELRRQDAEIAKCDAELAEMREQQLNEERWKLMRDRSSLREELKAAKVELNAARDEVSSLRLELIAANLNWQRTLNELNTLKAGASSRHPRDFSLLCQILGVDEGASASELKSAYRAWAHSYHPDKNPARDTTALFAAVKTAYERALGKV